MIKFFNNKTNEFYKVDFRYDYYCLGFDFINTYQSYYEVDDPENGVDRFTVTAVFTNLNTKDIVDTATIYYKLDGTLPQNIKEMKETGRKESLAKLLNVLNLSKEERKEVWNLYTTRQTQFCYRHKTANS